MGPELGAESLVSHSMDHNKGAKAQSKRGGTRVMELIMSCIGGINSGFDIYMTWACLTRYQLHYTV